MLLNLEIIGHRLQNNHAYCGRLLIITLASLAGLFAVWLRDLLSGANPIIFFFSTLSDSVNYWILFGLN